MKNPATFTFDSLLPDINRYDDIIDVRSPSEFAEDHIPGAINCPVLSDEQRCEVGTLYKVAGSFEAKKIGAAYAAQNIAGQITTMFRAKPKEWRPLVYCWRGGNRSGAMAHIFAKIGWSVTQLEGGYKDYRRHVIGALDALPALIHFRVICGPTGSGKSRLLRILAGQGAQVLDLEELANHRGSVLGNFPNERQPTQKAFESALWETLRRLDRNRVVFVECESKKIGNVHLPDPLVVRQISIFG
jgi:tRNA 2-selenouridine synthase